MGEASVRASPSPLIRWGVATLALAGEAESGDLHLVRSVDQGMLVAVVDGLGHGAEAALAARKAVAALDRHAGESLTPLLRRCHDALHATRGVVMSLAVFSSGVAPSLTWLGVGNVEGVLLSTDGGGRSTRDSLITRGGIVGSELPELRPQVVPVSPGDIMILATDGVRGGFADGVPADASPQQLADDILARYGRGTDDALVLVARYLGAGATG
jgi:serine/threonine protein phosphatase PrpC